MDRAALEDLFGSFALSVRRMFGGHGIFAGDLMVALEVGGTIYLKSDSQSAPLFEQRGCEAFSYASSRGARTLASFRRLPEEAFDDADVMREWMVRAEAAARRSARSKRPGKRQATSE